MKKRDIIRMILAGHILPGDIPTIGPGRMLIQTGPESFTDSLTGESFQTDQVKRMTEPFRNSPFIEGIITGPRERLLDQDNEVHENARIPYLTETEVQGVPCYQFKVFNIPSIATTEDAVQWALRNQINNKPKQ